LKQHVEDSLALFQHGEISKQELKERIKGWRKEPYQPDVADYFLNGPGRKESPFSNLFELIK
jgi:hypothetical protein